MNIVLSNSTHSLLKCMQTGCSVFVAYTALLMSNVLMDISLHADTRHRPVYLSRCQFIREIIDTSKLIIFEAIFRWDTWRRLSTAIHNPMRVVEWSNWLRYSWFCIRSSARSDLLLLSHEALLTRQQRLPMIFFFFLLFFLSFFSHFFFLIKNTV